MTKTLLTALALCAAALLPTARADEPIKTVYHLNEGLPQASRALGNIRNQLAADPTARIVVVAHGAGIDFLLQDAKDAQGMLYAGAVGDLANKGVQFRVCNNTLTQRGISPDRVLLEAKIVPSGVAEIARLQAREHYAYLKP